jgi:CBS domain-containing protein
MEKVWKNAGGKGYYRAKATDSVIDVMEGIVADANADLALVFDDSDKLLGLFTDYDYIKLATERAATTSSEEESASFIAAEVSNFVTPASKIICVDSTDTASQAIAMMTSNNIRHVILVDKCGPDHIYREGSAVKGVIKMQDLMRVIQSDERLSLDKLSKKFPGFADKPIEQMREELKSRANSLASNPETAKKDLIRAVTLAVTGGSVLLFASESSWLSSHAELAMIGIFVLGYIGIIFEEVFEFNKAAVALLMSTGMWVTYADFYGDSTGLASESVLEQLKDQLAEVSDICFFLLAASAIVEVVDAHQGFKVVTNLITTKSKKGLFWVIGFLTFFLSAILNNLTVTIVMVSLLRKLIPNDDDRRLFGAMVVVAANAGGVWTPIGDVTTTMLWINNQLSTIPTVTELFLPSVVCLVASLFFLVNQVEEDSSLAESTLPPPSPLAARGQVVFWTGIAALLAVPVFNDLTGLPPYIAMVSLLIFPTTFLSFIFSHEQLVS